MLDNFTFLALQETSHYNDYTVRLGKNTGGLARTILFIVARR